MISREMVLSALSGVIDPDLHNDLVSLGMIQDVEIGTEAIRFRLVLTTPACPLREQLKSECIGAVRSVAGEDVRIEVVLDSKVTAPRRTAPEKAAIPGVKNIVLVASGKGGVGKSTVAANIAVSLVQSGARVGLLDADIYGPSVPLMFGLSDAHPGVEGDEEHSRILPVEKNGLRIMSVGFFVDPSKALIWRGPMASNALKQLITDVNWGELDYLIVDTPPGTGDIHLTLLQSLPVSGVVVVTTPQEVALADARKAISMFRQDGIKVPVLGLVENMAYFTPAELPGNRYYIFGRNGGDRLAQECSVPVLGRIPLVQSICESGDAGLPASGGEAGPVSEAFGQLAGEITRQLSVWNALEEATRGIEPHQHKH